MKRHFSSKNAVFTCNICKVTLTSQLDLEIHKKSCEKNQNVKFDIQVVSGQVDLRRGLEELVWMCKINSAQYLCILCRYRTRRKETIRAHLLKHKRDDDLHESQVSEEVLEKSGPLTLKVQNGNNRYYKCTYTKCRYTSGHRGHLNKHVATHSDVRPFQCPYCPLGAKDKCNLTSHLEKQDQMHSSVFKYICSKCPFKTIRSTSFTAHMKSHTIRKSYRCDQCSFLTPLMSDLVRHMKVHTGVKPYSCNHCEYKSAYNSDLKRHMMRRHKVVIES